MALIYSLSLVVAHCLLIVQAQTISTTTPVPPLQWINLSNVVQGTNRPPPLRDAAIGYDETSRSLIIFGGLSENGLAQSQTFLLNLQTLSWSTPSPPGTLQGAPPSRSAALFGGDFAASKQVFVFLGSDGKALSDVWEYDFINQFWSQVQLSVGGPSPRWGASGGIDIRAIPNQDSTIPGPNNTFYLAGGFNGNSIDPLSDVWRLNISGILSSNLPNSVQGSWERISGISNLPGRVNQAGTIVMNQIVASGGCNSSTSSTTTNTACAKQDSFVINTQSSSAVSPGPCPAPRISPVLVPNLNAFDSSFASQTFMVLGGFNLSLWEDSNGHSQGEVAILDINTGSWTRVIPSGDPDSSGQEAFPSPREGAVAFAFTQALVGNARNIASDTIIFGGQDANGVFLSDIWLLRAYTGVVTPSNPIWAGFGDGKLQTGVNADGSGVKVQYLSECASLISTATNSHSPVPTKTGSNPGHGSSGPSGPAGSQTAITHLFNTSFAHKILATLSLVVLLPDILLFRWFRTNPGWSQTPIKGVAFISVGAFVGLMAYGLGVAGFVLAFTTLTSQSGSAHRQHLKTSHGIVGVIFFIGLYVLVPLLFICITCYDQLYGGGGEAQSQRSGSGHVGSIDLGEKVETSPLPLRSETPQSLRPLPPRSDTPLSLPNASPPSSPRPRTLSWDASNMLRPSNDGGLSAESTISKGFEVVNRPNGRKSLPGPSHSTGLHGSSYPIPSTRSLGEIDWLLRRRSLNVVGELDYAITQAHNAQYVANISGTGTSPTFTSPIITSPPPSHAILHTLTQLSIAGLAVVSLAQLWARAPRYLFAILFIILVTYYAVLILLACHHRPTSSLLTMMIWRLRGNSTQTDKHPTESTPPQGPYTHHRPTYRVITHPDELSYSQHASPLSADTDDNDDMMDEDTRQRAIEEEMDRREVSIVTVPRRKLTVVNPS
ncbi:hypothetical protein JR316_0004735 [Psilocybe cubensis]|uniref:Uncharacterized protein n=2 Tax=Psilocybe cubensis TaxID=181762 RepID=A0A8H7Y0Y3_PSICU|nr:hypothetical protein JR316_0004735 [Psilocybe cubensis]KAH9482635.1 hypothetical protein JR316_0004735 [Psilocybe cubensis]